MILDFFAGMGGWDEGLRLLGRDDVIGFEKDKAARATREAAGHATWHEPDIVRVSSTDFGGLWPITGLIASPPCQDFSLAGLKAGLEGARGKLVYEPMRFIEELQPPWIAMEQVPTVLPIWKHYEEMLRALGYRTWSGILDASEYGVPQQRKRAVLMAHTRPVSAPEPTHGDNHHTDDLWGSQRLPRVTMAQALGWTGAEVVLDSRGDGEGGEWTRSASFRSDRPARTVGEKARSWKVTPGDPPRQDTPGSVEITIEQGLLLQGFPVDYPVKGSWTKAWEQIGNVIPPPLAAAILKELL